MALKKCEKKTITTATPVSRYAAVDSHPEVNGIDSSRGEYTKTEEKTAKSPQQQLPPQQRPQHCQVSIQRVGIHRKVFAEEGTGLEGQVEVLSLGLHPAVASGLAVRLQGKADRTDAWIGNGVRYGMVWYGMARHGMVRYGTDNRKGTN